MDAEPAVWRSPAAAPLPGTRPAMCTNQLEEVDP
jgi:hypothetical protein